MMLQPDFQFRARYLGMLALITMLTAVVMLCSCAPRPRAEIGGTPVPAVSCEEDEVIGFVGVDELACVHIDSLR